MPAAPAAERCIAHPGRPAVDHCPNCERPRCGADATGPRCAVCAATVGPRVLRADELLVRAAIAAHLVALVVGVILQQYPGSPVFQFVAPAVGGAVVGACATAAAKEPRGLVLTRVRALATLYSVLATAYGFALEGTYSVLDLADPEVTLPYLAAAAGCWLLTSPPRKKVKASSGA